MSVVVTCHHMTTRRVNSQSAKDLNVCYRISPKADIKAEDQVQKYQGYSLLRSLRTTHAYSDTHRDNSIGFGWYFGHFYKINCIKRNIMCTVDSVSSYLLQEHHQSPRTWKATHLFTVCCLFTRSSVCYFQTLSPLPGSGIFGDAICMCLFVCLLVSAGIISLGTINMSDDAGKPSWSMRALLD